MRRSEVNSARYAARVASWSPRPGGGARRGRRTVRPSAGAGGVVNRCRGGWSAVADAPSAPGLAREPRPLAQVVAGAPWQTRRPPPRHRPRHPVQGSPSAPPPASCSASPGPFPPLPAGGSPARSLPQKLLNPLTETRHTDLTFPNREHPPPHPPQRPPNLRITLYIPCQLRHPVILVRRRRPTPPDTRVRARSTHVQTPPPRTSATPGRACRANPVGEDETCTPVRAEAALRQSPDPCQPSGPAP